MTTKKQTKQASTQTIWQESTHTNLHASTQERTVARKHIRKDKQEERYQQLSLFSAFSSIWQSPVP
jgi:hypothetical protein